MKKAILIEPKLLAEIKQKSPAVYEYYCNSPFTRLEFVDYSLEGYHMFIQKEMLDHLESLKKSDKVYIPRIILAFQAGYIFGRNDIYTKYGDTGNDSMKMALSLGALLNTGLNYPYYNKEMLLDTANFDFREKIPYSKCTYKEGQYFMALESIFNLHDAFNILFVDINAKRKSENLDNMGIVDFSSGYN